MPAHSEHPIWSPLGVQAHESRGVERALAGNPDRQAVVANILASMYIYMNSPGVKNNHPALALTFRDALIGFAEVFPTMSSSWSKGQLDSELGIDEYTPSSTLMGIIEDARNAAAEGEQ